MEIQSTLQPIQNGTQLVQNFHPKVQLFYIVAHRPTAQIFSVAHSVMDIKTLSLKLWIMVILLPLHFTIHHHRMSLVTGLELEINSRSTNIMNLKLKLIRLYKLILMIDKLKASRMIVIYTLIIFETKLCGKSYF